MSFTGGVDLDLLSLQMQQHQKTRQKVEIDQLKRRLMDPDSPEAQDKKLQETCKGFESIFINKLWQQMRATVPKDGYLHSKHEDMYLSMFDQEMSRKMADAGGIGLGDVLYRQLKEQTAAAGRVTSPTQTPDPLPIKEVNHPAAEAPAQKPAHTGADVSLEADFYTPAAAPQETAVEAPAAPAPEMPRTPERVQTRVDALADSIERVEGAVHNEGGPAPVLETPRVEPAEPWDAPIIRWPLDGQVSSDFGWRKDPFTGRQAWHAGIDVAAEKGSPIHACWPGKVVFSGENGGYGNMVVLEHEGGWRSYYAHNNENLVQVGDEVRAGRKIAEVGSTGRSTGPHLHFELRQGDQAWDPAMIQERLLAGLSVGNTA